MALNKIFEEKDAKVAYKEKYTAIQKQIDDLQKRLKTHQEKHIKDSVNWGLVGDLGHVYDVLDDLKNFK